jgi:CBS domain-containing protein
MRLYFIQSVNIYIVNIETHYTFPSRVCQAGWLGGLDVHGRATDAERTGILQSLTERMTTGRRSGFHLRQRTARDVMTPQPICVHPDTPLLAALNLLLEHRIQRLPVVDEAGRLVGLLGWGGVLRVLGRVMGAAGRSGI